MRFLFYPVHTLLHGRMNGWMDGWIDGWMHGFAHQTTSVVFSTEGMGGASISQSLGFLSSFFSYRQPSIRYSTRLGTTISSIIRYSIESKKFLCSAVTEKYKCHFNCVHSLIRLSSTLVALGTFSPLFVLEDIGWYREHGLI